MFIIKFCVESGQKLGKFYRFTVKSVSQFTGSIVSQTFNRSQRRTLREPGEGESDCRVSVKLFVDRTETGKFIKKKKKKKSQEDLL